MKTTQIIRTASALGVDVAVVLEVIGMPKTRFHRRRHAELTAGEADRVARIERIRTTTRRVFGDARKARQWLTRPSPFLGAPPIRFLATDAGTVKVFEELSRIEWGDLA